MNFMDLFQGIGTLVEHFQTAPVIAFGRLALIVLGVLLVYLGNKRVLEPLIMVPMGFGMVAINAGMMFSFAINLDGNPRNTLDLTNIMINTGADDAAAASTTGLMNIMQIDFLQPIYTLTFSNGLIACLVFMGIGVITDISPVLKYPFTSMLIALFAELGTILTFPIAIAMGFGPGEAASAAIIGTADGPMVLFASLRLAPDLFVPLTIIAYLYLSICYGVYPFLVKLLVPKHLRAQAIALQKKDQATISPKAKLMFDIIACTVLCLLFPVAAPLFLSFFLGNGIKEILVKNYTELLEKVFLYTATFFLGLLLGILCDANTLLGNEKVLKLLILGFAALLLAAVGGIIGGYVVYMINKKKFNPTIGVAGVSCIPTTAKVAQHAVTEANKSAFVLQYALGASVCGVITSAILTGIYVTVVLPLL
ncbi:MAG: sodium ion-translocating decarboxylase subunit beta [Clostridiales Family XIII bacterium]|jgi:oxaloacetate decarboxylase beta subunit|nr:sodium ion-translocating decarboxylase subunit beta [Clostridiales Family XIII bacterium]